METLILEAQIQVNESTEIFYEELVILQMKYGVDVEIEVMPFEDTQFIDLKLKVLDRETFVEMVEELEDLLTSYDVVFTYKKV